MSKSQPRTPKHPRLTPKQRVLARYPTAREMYDENWTPVVGVGLRCVLGRGPTHGAAWRAAAEDLRHGK